MMLATPYTTVYEQSSLANLQITNQIIKQVT